MQKTFKVGDKVTHVLASPFFTGEVTKVKKDGSVWVYWKANDARIKYESVGGDGPSNWLKIVAPAQVEQVEVFIVLSEDPFDAGAEVVGVFVDEEEAHSFAYDQRTLNDYLCFTVHQSPLT